VLASIIAAMFMIAIEATIVATVMPKIAGDLGGLNLYAWVFSAFLLTQTATTVVFGKLSDQFGRKPMLLVGIVIFLVASVGCGFAWSMPSMIVFRLLQGVGAGAIQPVGMTVVGDLYTAHERGKVQGYLASVWGISAVIGPLAGALIVQYLSWAWVFWINVPLGLLAMAGFMLFLHEGVAHTERSIDVAGAALFTIAIASFMIGLSALGEPQGTRMMLIAGAIFLLSAILFVWQERRAKEPMIALRLWGLRPILTANAATLLSGMVIIGLTTFLPMFVQGVLGQKPLVAGFALTMMVLGWPVASTLAAKNLVRFGLRRILLAGSLLMPVGTAAFVLMSAHTPVLVAGLGSLIVGFGMGLLSTSAIVLIQESVGWSERGSATASNIFARNLGSTLGATALGAVLNLGLARHGQGAVSSEELRHLLDASQSTDGADLAIRAMLGTSLHLTFVATFAISLATAAAAVLVPAVPLGLRQDAAAE
jgi:multidrug resistance protein